MNRFFKVHPFKSIIFLFIFIGEIPFALSITKKPDFAPKNEKQTVKEVKPSYHLPKKTAPGSAYYYYLLSKLDAYKGNAESSLNYLGKAIQFSEPSSFLEEERARESVEAHRIDEAMSAAKKSIQLNPSNSEAHLLLGKLFSARKETVLAIREYQEAIRLDRKNEEAYASLAREYLMQRDIDQAITFVERLKKEIPDSLTASYYLGTIYSSFKKNNSKAIQAFKEILDNNPEELRALQALGQIYLEQRQLSEALNIYQTITKLTPDDITASLRLGLLFYELKDYNAAAEVFKKILITYPTSDRVQYYLGVVYQTQKKEDLALKLLKEIPSNSPFYKDAIIRTVLIYQDHHQTAEAISLTEKAISQKKEIPELYDLLATLYSSQKRYKDGIQLLETAVKNFPKDDRLYFTLGVLNDKNGNFDSSIKMMKTAISLNPEQASAMNYIGYSYAEKGIHLPEALRLIEKAHTLHPKDGHIVDSLGWVYFKMGDLNKAYEYLNKAKELSPNEPIIFEHLGDLFYQQGDRKKSEEYYQQAMKILEKHPHSDEADPQTISRLKKKLSERWGLR